VTALDTPQLWDEAAQALARERAGRSPELFPHALGVDPDALRQWAAEDAVDTLMRLFGYRGEAARVEVPVQEFASALATHTQIGVELGLWLAQTGRVSA
jgi:hypothetical protein